MSFQEYNETPKQRTSGESVDQIETDIIGNQKVTESRVQQKPEDFPVAAYFGGYRPVYQAAASANVVVSASPAYLGAVTLGKWVSGGVIEISDHASDGDGNIQVYLEAGATDESGFPKTILTPGYFAQGITADQTGLTNVTYWIQ